MRVLVDVLQELTAIGVILDLLLQVIHAAAIALGAQLHSEECGDEHQSRAQRKGTKAHVRWGLVERFVTTTLTVGAIGSTGIGWGPHAQFSTS
jgi:hypothetical protein